MKRPLDGLDLGSNDDGGQAVVGNAARWKKGQEHYGQHDEPRRSREESAAIQPWSKCSAERCKGLSARGWSDCRFHGAEGGAPEVPAQGRHVHGSFSAATASEREVIRELIRTAQKTAASATTD